MKKITSFLVSFALAIAALFALTPTATAAVDSINYSITAGATVPATNSYVIRGLLYGVRIAAPAAATGTVAITCGGATIFSKAAITAGTNTYLVRGQIHNTSGTAQTVVDSGSNTNAVFGLIPLDGLVSTVVTKTDNATNTWVVTPIFEK